MFLPLQASIIEFAGWRTAVLLVAGVAITVAVVVGIFMRDDPRKIGLQAYGAGSEPEPVLAPPQHALSANPFKLAVQTLADGLRIPDFWFLAGSFAICGATTVGLISVHLIPASVEHGLTEVTAASMLAAMGVFDLVGTTASGGCPTASTRASSWSGTTRCAGWRCSSCPRRTRWVRLHWPGSSCSTGSTGSPPSRRRSSW